MLIIANLRLFPDILLKNGHNLCEFGITYGSKKRNLRCFAKALNLHKEHHVEEHARHEFHKAVVRHGVRETAGQMLLYIKEVVVFDIGESLSHFDSTVPYGCGAGALYHTKEDFYHILMQNSCKTHP